MVELANIRTVICEFLNISSIAGIINVASARSRWTRFAWVVVISICFVTAGYLINNSFLSWHQTPFITTVETLPISDAMFPVVTVCPPKGTNTALNHDIVAAKTVTLDNKTRIEAFEKAKSTIYEPILIEHIIHNVEFPPGKSTCFRSSPQFKFCL